MNKGLFIKKVIVKSHYVCIYYRKSNPMVGKAYAYEISSGSLSIFGENTKYEWYFVKTQKNGSWRDVTDKPKIGKSVTYTFHEPVLGNEFELRVFETKSGSITETGSAKKQIAKLDIVPSRSKQHK